MDLRKVKKLIELLEASELVEMEITEGKSTIRLSRASPNVSPPMTVFAGQHNLPGIQSVPESQPIASTGSSAASDTPALTGKTMESPMVGTFYNSSSPDNDPYVTVGSVVKPGDTLCIIEAMKTFNQVEAEFSGTIKAIYKSTGDPVEFGEPLFLID